MWHREFFSICNHINLLTLCNFCFCIVLLVCRIASNVLCKSLCVSGRVDLALAKAITLLLVLQKGLEMLFPSTVNLVML